MVCIVEGTSDNEKELKDLKVQIKETSGSWWRIMKLGKQEWKLYIIAFSFLLIASLSKIIIQNKFKKKIFLLAEIFQPLFSGHIISSVVSNDWHRFILNIFWYLGVSII
jgi:hypothetical protein